MIHAGLRCSGRCSPLPRTSTSSTTTSSKRCSRRFATSASPATHGPIRSWSGALIIGPRPADDAMRMMDELADWRPPGSQDLPRAALLAMLGRFDEAWPLAEARSSHLREVTGNTSRDAYGVPRADRDDRRRPGARMPVRRRRDRSSSPTSPSRRRRPSPVSHASSATSVASTRLSDSSKRLGPSRHPVPAFG